MNMKIKKKKISHTHQQVCMQVQVHISFGKLFQERTKKERISLRFFFFFFKLVPSLHSLVNYYLGMKY